MVLGAAAQLVRSAYYERRRSNRMNRPVADVLVCSSLFRHPFHNFFSAFGSALRTDSNAMRQCSLGLSSEPEGALTTLFNLFSTTAQSMFEKKVSMYFDRSAGM